MLTTLKTILAGFKLFQFLASWLRDKGLIEQGRKDANSDAFWQGDRDKRKADEIRNADSDPDDDRQLLLRPEDRDKD